MTKEKQHVADEEFGVISKKLWEIQRRFKEGSLSYETLNLFLQLMVEGKLNADILDKGYTCKQIYTNRRITIEPTDGKTTFANSDSFKAYLDPRLNSHEFNVPGEASKQSFAHAYDLVLDCDLKTMFSSISSNFDEICFTQHQVVTFCRYRKDMMKQKGSANFFIIKNQGSYFIVNIRIRSMRQLDATLYDIDYGFSWPGSKTRRLFCRGHQIK